MRNFGLLYAITFKKSFLASRGSRIFLTSSSSYWSFSLACYIFSKSPGSFSLSIGSKATLPSAIASETFYAVSTLSGLA
jgi:hypothetical protein